MTKKVVAAVLLVFGLFVFGGCSEPEAKKPKESEQKQAEQKQATANMLLPLKPITLLKPPA